jgi:hypothetical protein
MKWYYVTKVFRLSIELDELFLAGSHFAAFVFARLLGCIHRKNIEGRDVNGE